MRHLVKDKQFLMLRYLAESIDWPDVSLHEELVQGFRLVGEGSRSHVFRWEPKPARLSPEELMQKAKFVRPAILGRVSHMDKPEYLAELNAITRSEADEKGWLQGPLSFEQVKAEVGSDWLPVQRFAVRQKNKLRPIDNFSENFVNEAWTVPEKIDLHALDQLTWLTSILYRHAGQERCIDLPLKDGTRLRGEVHPGWTADALMCELTTVDQRCIQAVRYPLG